MVLKLSKTRAKLRLVSSDFNNSRSYNNKKSSIKPYEKFEHEREKPPLRALTPKQGEYLKALNSSQQVIVMGCAGTGKTYIAANYAADKFRQRKYTKIVITRPNIPGGKSLGFFPGSLAEKIAPWVVPLVENMKDRMGAGAFDIALANNEIEIVPFEVMRGRSFKNAIVILDESQNCTPAEIKMFLTRIGEDCQVIINGDVQQSDLKETSGLATIIRLAKSQMLPIPIIEFEIEDIVRSDWCATWVKAFHKAGI